VLSVCLVLSVVPGPAAAGEAPADSAVFPRPSALSRAVHFWKQIFAVYGTDRVVVHDSEDLGIVYGVEGLGARTDTGRERQRQQAQEAVLNRYQRAAERLARGVGDTASLAGEERRIWLALGRTPDPARYRLAQERLRLQVGQRDRFVAGLTAWDEYRHEIERILRYHGVPDSLAVLPFVESSYNARARSSAGAVGLWQITKPAGRRFLRIGRKVDERQDPLKATHAAAQILKANRGSLGNWPLAITAYNHGPAGVARGVKEVGSRDIGELVQRYRGRAFGFASRNFYAEFLAALEVIYQRQLYFGTASAEGEGTGETLPWAQLEPTPVEPPAEAAERAPLDSLAGLREQVLVFTTVDSAGLAPEHLAGLRGIFRIPPEQSIRWFRWGPSLAPPGVAAHGATWYTVWYARPAGLVTETLIVAASGEVLERVRWPDTAAVLR
jgi:membrane-bound lytic murein transglycosylase D